MKVKYLIAGVFALATLLVVLAIVLDLGRGASAGTDGEQGTGDSRSNVLSPDAQNQPQSNPTVAPTGQSELGKEGSSEKGTDSDPGQQPEVSPTRPSWNPQPESSKTPEVKAPDGSAPASTSLPKSVDRKPVLDKVTATGVAEGKLTEGFPKKAIPVPEKTTVIQSSVEDQSGMVLVGLEARSELGEQVLLDFYRTHFKQLDWPVSESTPVEGTTQLSAGLGKDTTTVTVRLLPTGVSALNVAGAYWVGD